ncbi:MAG: phBC6A51 family helix-turn-helix protein [Oscillospiraceae bacterium]
MSDPNCDLTVGEISENLNINKKTLDKWLNDDNFFNENLKQFNSLHKYYFLDILKTLNKMAKEGDMKAIKMIFDMKDKLEIKNDDKKVVIIDDIPK